MLDEEVLSRNKNLNRSYRKLEIWKLAIELFRIEYDLLSNLKIDLKLKSQILDSSFSVHSNITEGHSRRSKKELIRFIDIALSSLAENYSQMFALFNTGIISNNLFDLFDGKCFELENKLLKFIKSLIDKSVPDDDWRVDYSK
ncbi:MAG TPA: four helix bundle protein [Melioribacteraceae bacterium]|nr:four helix bundle protein [Melioribacteraceae bacterium]